MGDKNSEQGAKKSHFGFVPDGHILRELMRESGFSDEEMHQYEREYGMRCHSTPAAAVAASENSNSDDSESDDDGDCGAATVQQLDAAESRLTTMLDNGCGCAEKCSEQVDRDDAIFTCRSMRALGVVARRERLDLVLRLIAPINRGHGRRCTYLWRGQKVCQEVFARVMSVSMNTIKHAITPVREASAPFYTRHVGDTAPGPKVGEERYAEARAFLEQACVTWGMVSPRRVIAKNGRPTIMMGAVHGVRFLHRQYKAASEAAGKFEAPLSLASFHGLLREEFSHITTLGPRSDLCETCQERKTVLWRTHDEDGIRDN